MQQQSSGTATAPVEHSWLERHGFHALAGVGALATVGGAALNAEAIGMTGALLCTVGLLGIALSSPMFQS